MTALPIDDVLPAVRAALAEGNRLVLAAPPGAGKTTRAPLDLLSASWLDGRKILLLEPRRIAARMAAERMAATLGERVGARVGLSTRVDRRVSAETRIEVVTDGLFARRILDDPSLEGVGAVFFDEFHERSLAADLGLAFAVDAQSALRPDLRLVLMSATLDTARVAAAFAAPVIESHGRMHPVETRYLGRSDAPVDQQMERAIRRALAEEQGSALAFLPGKGEILRTAARLADLGRGVVVAPLYGALSPDEQDAAVAPPPAGTRKVVLATDIAESALTIEAVRIVIDAGLARVATYEPGGGTVLATRRAARANVDQRRGRAGRTAPGVCYRLWDEAATRGLPAEPEPEIALADLSGLLLATAAWGEAEPRRLFWVDPPTEGRLASARSELEALGAFDASGRLSAKGRAIAALPLEPRLAALVAGAGDPSDRALAAEIAALAGERGLGGPSTDIRDRIERFRRDPSARARTLRAQAAGWSGRATPASSAESGRVVAAALPLAVARRKSGQAGQYLVASGRAAALDLADPLSGSEWLAIVDMTGAAAGARIVAAAPLDERDALRGGVLEEDVAQFDAQTGTIRARRIRRLGAIVLSETPLARPSGDVARAALVDALAAHGLAILPAADAVRAFAARLALARSRFGEAYPDVGLDALVAAAEAWLSPLLGEPPSLANPDPAGVTRALGAWLGQDAARALDRDLPSTWTTPAGRRLAIDYGAEGGPRVEARAQEFFGLAEHPCVARGLPLTLSLLSPAGRPAALTRDIVAFWAGGYRDMAKDMRSQYPKHDWPSDPANARPHVGKTKARMQRES